MPGEVADDGSVWRQGVAKAFFEGPPDGFEAFVGRVPPNALAVGRETLGACQESSERRSRRSERACDNFVHPSGQRVREPLRNFFHAMRAVPGKVPQDFSERVERVPASPQPISDLSRDVLKRFACVLSVDGNVDQKQLEHELRTSKARVEALTQQLEWFKRELFGRKSEKRLVVDSPQQPLLKGLLDCESTSPSPEPTETLTYTRRKPKQRGDDCVTEEGLRFDESVPVHTMELSAPQLDGPNAEDYEIIAYKTTRRLAQRPGSYVVLEYVRPVIKRKSTMNGRCGK